MELNILINSIGLILDILGAILLFKYGLPEDISRNGASFLLISSGNKNEIEKAKKYDFLGKIGLGLLILGFILQLLSNFIPN